ncbi:acyl carrier protein [Ancylobacter sp.]|uniref:acyl carrier protein n=1 Tax=Ancylobacter sp. TaxID=1872567 RepID=UPI003D0BCD44
MQEPFGATQIGRWIIVYLAVISGEDSDAIALDANLSAFDIDSVDAVEMAMQFEKAFNCQIGAEFFLRDEATIQQLADELAVFVATSAA